MDGSANGGDKSRLRITCINKIYHGLVESRGVWVLMLMKKRRGLGHIDTIVYTNKMQRREMVNRSEIRREEKECCDDIRKLEGLYRVGKSVWTNTGERALRLGQRTVKKQVLPSSGITEAQKPRTKSF